MKGSRWKSVIAGFKRGLRDLRAMKDVLVSAFSFDHNVNPHIKEKTPDQAAKIVDKMPFTMGETNYTKALETMLSYIENINPKFKGYCHCLMFLSDGQGGYPAEAVEKIVNMKKGGEKIIFYTIACNCDVGDEEDLMKMATAIDGDHYRIENQEASKLIFRQIIQGS